MYVSMGGILSILGGGLGGPLGVDGGWLLLPTRPQYCDPASLVVLIVLYRVSFEAKGLNSSHWMKAVYDN